MSLLRRLVWFATVFFNYVPAVRTNERGKYRRIE